MNPLLTKQNFPVFSQIKPEHIVPALEQVLKENRDTLKSVLAEKGSYTWKNLMSPMEEMDAKLHAVWSPVSHLHSVLDSEALREVYNVCLPKISDYATEISQNQTLYEAILSIKESDVFESLEQAQKQTIENALRDFRLSGVALPEDKKQQFADLQKALSQASTKFSQNVLDATQSWTVLLKDEKQLAGLPEHAIASAKQAADAKGKEGYLLTLEIPSYLAVMQYADDRDLREKMYEAYVTRASELGPDKGKFDNSEVMLEILRLRKSMAVLLGFNHYAEHSLATKMASSAEEVLEFLADLTKKGKPLAETEIADLNAYTESEFGATDLQPWDITYYSEKLRRKRYDISQEDLRPYFALDTVLQGLFKLLNTLYNITITEKPNKEIWHPDVKFYEVSDADGSPRGYFYLDVFVRENKRGGAWMDDCRVRRKIGDTVELPIAFVVCNFAKALADKPALLTHDDVVTLFHEFGHCFHHLLTKIDYPDVSGINGVAWDAVELPSQFMENWCWQKDVLDWIAKHYETGEPLPDSLFDRMLNAKNYHSGMQMMRQLEFSVFDFLTHIDFQEDYTREDIKAILQEVKEAVAVVPSVDYSRFQCAFNHVFGGGYAAGYYSYKWAEVLSADAFALFEESGLLESTAGKLFLEHILEKGGSEEMKVLYKNFRGRDATVDALLKHSGIA